MIKLSFHKTKTKGGFYKKIEKSSNFKRKLIASLVKSNLM